MDTRGEVTGDRVSVEARVWDLKAHQLMLGRRYSDFRVFYTDDQRRRILQENFILAFSAVRRARFW